MSIFNKISSKVKAELLKTAIGINDITTRLHLLSNEELLALKDKLENILHDHDKILALTPEEEMDFHTELEEIEFADDIHSLASLADSLDQRGLHGASKIIDALIETKVKRLASPERRRATFLRKKHQYKKAQGEGFDEDAFEAAWWDSGMETYGPGSSGMWGEMADQAYEFEVGIRDILENLEDPEYSKYKEKFDDVMREGGFVEDLEDLYGEMVVQFPQARMSSETFSLSKRSANEYKGEKVKLNDPIRNPKGSKKKFHVFVKDPKSGNVRKVQFGDPNMEIKRDDPERRKSFRARHQCEKAKDKTKAKYWSCYQWRKDKKVDN